MVHVIKILLFAIVNFLGWNALPTLANVAIMTGFYPKFSSEPALAQFNHYFFGVGTWVWVAAAIISICYFFVRSIELRMILILAPLACPILYGIALIAYSTYSSSF